MWKKPESETSELTAADSSSSVTSSQSADKSVLGTSLKINGDLSGTEDLVIQGHVEGKVDLKKNDVTVGKHGRVKADIYAENIVVEGEVQGNLFGTEKITIRKSGSLRGSISGPRRVNVEDGARFKGSIDMDGGQEQAQTSTSSSSSSSKDESEKPTAVSTTKTDTKGQISREEDKHSPGHSSVDR